MKKNGIRAFNSLRLPARATEERLTVNVGHDGARIAVVFSRPARNMLMTIEECEAHIANLQGSIDTLKTHKEAGNGPTTQG